MSEPKNPVGHETDIRPIVRTAKTGAATIWLFGGGLAIAGLLLFNTLNQRRQAVTAQTEVPSVQGSGMISAPPPLNLPQADQMVAPYAQPAIQPPPLSFPTVNPATPSSPSIVTRLPQHASPAPLPVLASPLEQQAPTPKTVAVVERPASPAGQGLATSSQGDRVTAGRLANPSLTVPQGTIVAAVLETALDSTQSGAVRAIVSRDVRSFDGSKVLIPRGSRLYGEYESDLAAGQKRALVMWHRLTRPDAVIIDMGSPAADPLGRAGVEGKVDTHFFERFGGAILQSVLDVGVAAASRSVSNYPVLVALPGSTQQVTRSAQNQNQVQPTLKVKQGSSVSVFVARDLDFSTVDH